MDPAYSQRKNTIKQLCNSIVFKYPEAMCMALIELDCGCVHICAVSVSGQPVGRMRTYSGTLEDNGDDGPICIRCAGAGGPVMDRIVRRELVWPGEEVEKPNRELRDLIGQAVFGDDFQEA